MARYAFLPLLLLASSFVSNVAGAQSSSLTFCYTYTGSKSVKPVPTKFSTSTKDVDVTLVKTVVPTKTITPSAVTQTSTKTSTITTTKSVQGSISTSTSTTYTLVTVMTKAPTSTSTSTAFTFTTSIHKYVSTVPAPQGFQPVQSTIPGSKNKRDITGGFVRRLVSRRKRWTSFFAVDREEHAAKKSYPEKVECNIIILDEHTVTVTRTQPTSTVQGPTPTSLATTTTQLTSTSTVMEANSVSTTSTVVTLRVTSTTTPVQTSTSTSTYTFTKQSATATSYAECGPSNFVRSFNGLTPYTVSPEDSQAATNNYTVAQTSANTTLSCCNLCAMNDLCEISFSGIQSGNFTCVNVLANSPSTTCSAAGQWVWNTTFSSDSSAQSATLSNGNCGVYEMFQ